MTQIADFDRSAHFSTPEAAREASERDAKHIARFLELSQGGQATAAALEELYLIRVDRNFLWELIGFRVKGHPTVILGAVEVPRQASSVEHGRTMIGQFLSKPPRYAAAQGTSLPPGLMSVAVPFLNESMSQFFERVRSTAGTVPVLHVDAELVDFAFDFRAGNPSELEHMKPPSNSVNPTAFRTVEGHVITATAHGLYYTLARESNFVTVTGVVQHRPGRSHRLPTLCMNRKYIAFERQVMTSENDIRSLDTLAFHPVTARDAHLFGTTAGSVLD